MAKKDSEKPEKQATTKIAPSQENVGEEPLSDEALEDVSGGRDFASGHATGKRQYKPVIVKMHY